MGILLVYDVTDERSFNSMYTPTEQHERQDKALANASTICEARECRAIIEGADTLFSRHPDMVLERGATRNGRRQQDPHRQQVRLGGEAGRFNRARTGVGQRTWHTIHGSFREEQHQRRESLLQPGERYKEANRRHPTTPTTSTSKQRASGRWRWRGGRSGEELLLKALYHFGLEGIIMGMTIGI